MMTTSPCRLAIAALALICSTWADGAESAGEKSGPPLDISEYRVLGNTRLSDREIETVLYPRLGPQKTFEDVEAARAALERRYHDLGFGAVFVDIPEQKVDAGVVRLHVTEGRIDRVRISGARYYSNRALLAQLPEIASSGTPNFQELQKELAKVNAQTADRQIQPVLRAGQTPGTMELELKVEDRLPLRASLQLDNRYTADTRPLRATASLGYDNLWQRGDSASFQYQTAPQRPSSVEVWSGTYLMRFTEASPVLSLYAISTNSSVATLGTLSVLGAGKIYGTRLTLPWVSSSQSQSLAFGFDFKRFRDNVQVTSAQGISDAVSYMNLSAQYTFSSADAHGSTSLTGTSNLGLRVATPSSEQSYDDKRFGARPNYFVLRAAATRTQNLFANFRGYVELDGQVSPEPLISNEEFSAGGATTVRGYYEAEELGDQGVHATFELRSPTLGTVPVLNSSYLFGFFDWATLAIRESLPGQTSHATLDSAGVALHLGPYDGIESGIDWAYPLRDAVRTLRGQDRVEFFVRYSN